MKRLCTFTAALVILMAGFMSVCNAADDCDTTTSHNAHHVTEAQATKTADAKHDACGMLCHVAPHNVPQVTTLSFKAPVMIKERISSTSAAISLGLSTVPYQPPRA